MFFDIGSGILLAWLTAMSFHINFSWSLILFGIVFSLLPDLDVLFHLRKGKKLHSHKGHDHRDMWHYPLPYIVIGVIVVGLFSWRIAFLFAFTSLVHFLHDSIGIGWGIAWLYPFSKKYFSFFYHYDIFRNKLPKRIIYSWTRAEVEKLSDTYGDKDWVKNIYLKWHPYAIVEFSVFTLAVILMIYLKF